MSLQRKASRHMARQGVSTKRLEAIIPVPGVSAGFLMGTVTLVTEDDVYEVITHPDLKEYTIRTPPGCDDAAGKVINMTEAYVAGIGLRVGKKILTANDLPAAGVYIMTTSQKTAYALTIEALVNEVLNAPLPTPPEEIVDGPQG